MNRLLSSLFMSIFGLIISIIALLIVSYLGAELVNEHMSFTVFFHSVLNTPEAYFCFGVIFVGIFSAVLLPYSLFRRWMARGTSADWFKTCALGAVLAILLTALFLVLAITSMSYFYCQQAQPLESRLLLPSCTGYVGSFKENFSLLLVYAHSGLMFLFTPALVLAYIGLWLLRQLGKLFHHRT